MLTDEETRKIKAILYKWETAMDRGNQLNNASVQMIIDEIRKVLKTN